MPILSRLQTGLMSLGIACILWLAAVMAAGLDASVRTAQAEQPVAQQQFEASDGRLSKDIGLPPGGQWRLNIEQGRRLEGGADPELYRMLLAWFQHDILGWLCGLMFFLPSSISGKCLLTSALSTGVCWGAITCNSGSATATDDRLASKRAAEPRPLCES